MHHGAWLSPDQVFSQIEEFTPTVELDDPPPKRTYPYPEWHDQASCVGMPDTMFFGSPDPEARPAITMREIAEAKSICADCPVFATCLTTALEAHEEYGIWAGTSGRTRTRIWALIEAGAVTIEDVVADFVAGKGGRYEHRMIPRQHIVIEELPHASNM